MRHRDQHACMKQWNFAFLRITHNQVATLAREQCFQRAGQLVESGMNDTTVESGCLAACRLVFFERYDRKAFQRKLASNGAADNAARAYDADVVHRSGKSVKMPSTG